MSNQTELQKRADHADQSVLFFLAGANFWEKHAKNRRKQAQTRENRRKTGAFLVLIFWGGKLVGATFYAFCDYASTFFCHLLQIQRVLVVPLVLKVGAEEIARNWIAAQDLSYQKHGILLLLFYNQVALSVHTL